MTNYRIEFDWQLNVEKLYFMNDLDTTKICELSVNIDVDVKRLKTGLRHFFFFRFIFLLIFISVQKVIHQFSSAS